MNRVRFHRPIVLALVPDVDLRVVDDAEHTLLDEAPAAVGAVAEFCK